MGKTNKTQKKPLPPCEPHKVAYFVYRDEVYPKMKEKYKSVNKGDMAELISNQWDSLDKPTKQQYQKKLDKIKGDYEIEKMEYETKYGKIDPEQQRKRQLLETKRKEGIQKSDQLKNKKKKAEKKKTKKQTQSEETQEQISESQEEQQQKSKPNKRNKSKSTSKSKTKASKLQQSKKKKSNSKAIKGNKKQDDENYKMMWVVDKNVKSEDEEDQ